ncbi:MAG: hypothetical protein PHR25_01355 [Clostridia bacterium]|nr:hypothetical protein [Clostridia bacterium]MDD4375414.1 hypothetical protein [Clostridia bacterium]
MKVSFEDIFDESRILKMGMMQIYYSHGKKKAAEEIVKTIEEMAKSLKIKLDNIPSGETVNIFLYPTASIFYKLFRGEVEKKTIGRLGSVETLILATEGEIHVVAPNYGNKITILSVLIKEILKQYELEEKTQSAQKKVKNILTEKEEIINETEEELEEIEENEIEENEIEEELEEIEEIEKVKEKAGEEIPTWLSLGWHAFKLEKLNKTKSRENFAMHIENKGLGGLKGITGDSKIGLDYNYDIETGAAIIEYIINTYGARKVLDLFWNPNIKETLGEPEAKFWKECKDGIKNNYKMILKQKYFEEAKKEFVKKGVVDAMKQRIEEKLEIKESNQIEKQENI